MSLQDPIADMLTRLRNAARARHETVLIPASGLKEAILRVFAEEGYVSGYERRDVDAKPHLVVRIAYAPGENTPVLHDVQRVSRPGRRVYCGVGEVPKVLSGIGHAVLSTSKGVMTGQRAKRLGVGGEVICTIH